MVDYNPVRIGQRFARIRASRNMGQAELALALGYSNNSQLSEFENGKGMLPLDKILKAAEILGVPPWFLVTDDDCTSREIELMSLFYRKMIKAKNHKHAESIEHLLKS